MTPAPKFVVGSTPTSGLSATVTDTLSGAAQSPVSATLGADDVDEPGAFSAPVTGSDVAGNTTTVDCPFIVGYEFGGYPAADPAVVVQARLDHPRAVPAR